MGRVNVVLCCCSLLDMGFPDLNPQPRVTQQDIQHLYKCMIVDFGSRLVEEEGFRVNVMETDDCNLEEIKEEQWGFGRIKQRGSLQERMDEATATFFPSNQAETLVMMYGNNPLLAPELLRRMEGLLHQEEETVVIAEERFPMDGDRVVCAAMRTYHPALFAGAQSECPHGIASFLRAEAMLVPVKPVYDFSHPQRLPLLLHEVERRMLLGRWYPHRSLAALNTMHRKGMFEKLS